QPAGIRIVSGRSAVDSIDAVLREPLAVIVTGDAGKPVAGAVVSFSAPVRNSVFLMGEGNSNLPGFVDTTDATGRAAIRVHFGWLAGRVPVVIRVSSMGFADTAQYTVTPGALARIAPSPADTVAYVGTSYAMRASTMDRLGNVRLGDAVTLSLASGPGRFDPNAGTVTTTDLGRVAILARSGAVAE